MIVEARRDVVTLRGSLSENEWSTIQAAAKLLLEEHPKGIIIDCSGLTEVTESGAKTFLEAINYIQKHDAKIIVAGLPENALEVMRSVRAVMSQLPIAPNVEAARASLGLEDLGTLLSRTSFRAIAVLLVGDWQRAVEISCKLADRKADELHVIELLKVPRNMPIATPMPEAEAMTRRKLDDSERAARQARVRVIRHVERVRTIGEGVQRVLASLQPYAMVICIKEIDELTSELVNVVMPGLLSNPPCEVLYCRRPEDFE